MPEEVVWLDKSDLLSFEEIARFVRIASQFGVNKLRLTGGEPLLRHRLADLVRLLVVVPGIDDLGLTTNALLLAEQADELREAGVHRLNISLDTLRPETFRQIARRNGLDKVLAGIDAARLAGFASIKLNAVVVRGLNEDDVVPLARFASERGMEMRFIEYMPIGAEPWERHQAVLAHEILDQLEREFGPLAPAENYDPRAPAMEFRSNDGRVRIGIIASISRPFCRQCNRVRITADGKLRHCLFALEEVDVKSLLRSGANDETIAKAMQSCVWSKWEGHEINSARFIKPPRTMHAIGG
jgi:cyclic pyranopterin phosphate synthase